MGFTPVNAGWIASNAPDEEPGNVAESAVSKTAALSLSGPSPALPIPNEIGSLRTTALEAPASDPEVPFKYPQARVKAKTSVELSSLGARGLPEPLRLSYASLPEAATIKPAEALLADPVAFVARMEDSAMKGRAFKIIAPATSNIPLKADVDADTLPLTGSVQVINQRDGGKALRAGFCKALKHYFENEKPPQSNNAATDSVLADLPLDFDGRPIDPYRAHRCVQLRKGYAEVCRRKMWSQVARDIGASNLPSRHLRTWYLGTIEPFDHYLRTHGIDLTASPRSVLFDVVEPGTPAKENQAVLPNGITVITTSSEVDTISESPSPTAYTLRQYFNHSLQFKTAYFGISNPSTVAMEREYWRMVSGGVCMELEQMHGVGVAADCVVPLPILDAGGSPYSPKSPWNLGGLAFAPGSMLPYLQDPVPFAYSRVRAGMTFSTRKWSSPPPGCHEISVLHHGARRTWYVVAAQDAGTVRRLSENGGLPSPDQLLAQGVSVEYFDQCVNEIVVIPPGSIAMAFDHGFNFSESAHVLSADAGLPDALAASMYAPQYCYDKLLVKAATYAEDPRILGPLAPFVHRLLDDATEMLSMLAERELTTRYVYHDDPVVSESGQQLYLYWIEREGRIYSPAEYLTKGYSDGELVSRGRVSEVLAELKEKVRARIDSPLAAQTATRQLLHAGGLQLAQLENMALASPWDRDNLLEAVAAVQRWDEQARQALDDRPTLAAVEALINAHRNLLVESPLLQKLVDAREAALAYVQLVHDTLADIAAGRVERGHDALASLVAAGSVQTVQTDALAVAKVAQVHAIWASDVTRLLAQRSGDLERLGQMLDSARQMEVSVNSRVLVRLRMAHRKGYEFSSHLKATLMGGLDAVFDSDLVKLQRQAESSFMRRADREELAQAGKVHRFSKRLDLPSPAERPRLDHARRYMMQSAKVAEAVERCEQWTRAVPDVGALIQGIDEGNEGMLRAAEVAMMLRVVPNEISEIVEAVNRAHARRPRFPSLESQQQPQPRPPEPQPPQPPQVETPRPQQQPALQPQPQSQPPQQPRPPPPPPQQQQQQPQQYQPVPSPAQPTPSPAPQPTPMQFQMHPQNQFSPVPSPGPQLPMPFQNYAFGPQPGQQGPGQSGAPYLFPPIFQPMYHTAPSGAPAAPMGNGPNGPNAPNGPVQTVPPTMYYFVPGAPQGPTPGAFPPGPGFVRPGDQPEGSQQ